MMQLLGGGASAGAVGHPGLARPWGGRSASLLRLPSITWALGDGLSASDAGVPGAGPQLQLLGPPGGLAKQQLQLEEAQGQQQQGQQPQHQPQQPPLPLPPFAPTPTRKLQQAPPSPTASLHTLSTDEGVMADVKALEGIANAALGARAVLKRPAMATSASPVVTKRPHFDIERSRGQVMCRTGGKGVGQSFAIKFSTAGSETKAVQKAKKWMAEQLAGHA